MVMFQMVVESQVNRPLQNESSVILKQFMGQFCKEMQCTRCGFKGNKYDMFTDVSLALKTNSRICQLNVRIFKMNISHLFFNEYRLRQVKFNRIINYC